MSKPGKSLKSLCKRLKVRLTVKRNGKRVYKSVKVLKAQCAREKKKVKRKKVKRKKVKRRRKFGDGKEQDREGSPQHFHASADARTPGHDYHPVIYIDSPSDFPSPGLSSTDSDSESDEEESYFTLPPPIVRTRLDFSNMFGKKKKVKSKRKKKVKNKSR